MITDTKVGKNVFAYPALTLNRGFSKYAPEATQGVRGRNIVNTSVVADIVQAFESMRLVYRFAYKHAEKLIRPIDYSPQDIQGFCLAIKAFEDTEYFKIKAGTFLSALINNGKQEDCALSLAHCRPLQRLGYYNTKNVTIDGDVGDELGYYMKTGQITVHGTARDAVGYCMTGGKISIYGDLAIPLDFMARGGKRIVRIDLGHVAKMLGGEIHIFGDFDVAKSKESVIHGKIFHKGKLVVDK